MLYSSKLMHGRQMTMQISKYHVKLLSNHICVYSFTLRTDLYINSENSDSTLNFCSFMFAVA